MGKNDEKNRPAAMAGDEKPSGPRIVWRDSEARTVQGRRDGGESGPGGDKRHLRLGSALGRRPRRGDGQSSLPASS